MTARNGIDLFAHILSLMIKVAAIEAAPPATAAAGPLNRRGCSAPLLAHFHHRATVAAASVRAALIAFK